MPNKYLIIGCGAAGSTAAETIPQAESDAAVTILSHERLQAVARPRLVEYAAGSIPAEELETKDATWAQENNLDVRLRTRAEKIDVKEHRVSLAGGETLAYDRLLVAVGITPRGVPFEGKELTGVGHMHYLPEADVVHDAIARADAVVAVGGGLLGQDICTALAAARTKRTVHLLVREPYVGQPLFDSVTGGMLGDELRGLGIDLRLETEVAKIVGKDGRVAGIVTTAGEEIACQACFVAIGASPNVKWLADGGVPVGRGLVVDGRLASSAADVFAAGSCAEIHLDDKVLMQASWGNAMSLGRMAARNMMGGDEVYNVPSDYMTKVGETKFTLFGAPQNAFPKARYVGFRGSQGDYAALLVDGGLVRGGVMVGKHARRKEIRNLQLREEPVPGLADLGGEQSRSLSDFLVEALGL